MNATSPAVRPPPTPLGGLHGVAASGPDQFGDPNLGFFRTEFGDRRSWLSEAHYADVVALCQFPPGPTSSKVGIIIGETRAGITRASPRAGRLARLHLAFGAGV